MNLVGFCSDSTVSHTLGHVVQRRVQRDDTKPQVTAKQVTRYVYSSTSSVTTSISHTLHSCTKCRLQLKVVNSDSRLVQQFDPSDTLSVVKECASQVLW